MRARHLSCSHRYHSRRRHGLGCVLTPKSGERGRFRCLTAACSRYPSSVVVVLRADKLSTLLTKPDTQRVSPPTTCWPAEIALRDPGSLVRDGDGGTVTRRLVYPEKSSILPRTISAVSLRLHLPFLSLSPSAASTNRAPDRTRYSLFSAASDQSVHEVFACAKLVRASSSGRNPKN